MLSSSQESRKNPDVLANAFSFMCTSGLLSLPRINFMGKFSVLIYETSGTFLVRQASINRVKRALHDNHGCDSRESPS